MILRPQLRDPALLIEVAARLLPGVLRWFGPSMRPDDAILKDLTTGLTVTLDGYGLAKWLEIYRDWSPDGSLVTLLNQASFLRDDIYDQKVRQWVEDNQVQPGLSVGDTVKVRDGSGVEHTGQIRCINYEEARYQVFAQSMGHGSRVKAMGVPYEQVEQT